MKERTVYEVIEEVKQLDKLIEDYRESYLKSSEMIANKLRTVVESYHRREMDYDYEKLIDGDWSCSSIRDQMNRYKEEELYYTKLRNKLLQSKVTIKSK